MKKSFNIVVALCLGMLIGMSTTAFGESAKEYVQASFEKFTFIVNGEKQNLSIDPLVYQGTTYLPVRAISNALGYDVTYKADSKTINLNQTNTSFESDILFGKSGDILNTVTTEDQSKQKTIIENQLKAYNERLVMYESAVERIKNDPNFSEEDKKWGIDLRQSTIDSIKERIKELETQMSELEK